LNRNSERIPRSLLRGSSNHFSVYKPWPLAIPIRDRHSRSNTATPTGRGFKQQNDNEDGLVVAVFPRERALFKKSLFQERNLCRPFRKRQNAWAAFLLMFWEMMP
jgi:hypothetical protein